MKKSLLPKEIKVGYRTFRVTTSKAVMDKAHPDHHSWDQLAGLTAPAQNLIWLRHKGVPDSYVRGTLLHELMHVAVEMSSTQHLLSEQGKHADHEENYVGVIAEGLYTILMDNPHVMAFIFGGAVPDAPSVG